MCSNYQREEITVLEEVQEINVTYDWYVTHGAASPRPGSKVTPLYCGEQVFTEIEKAIINATHSITLVFWRIDESTRLTTQSTNTIMQQLEKKSQQGIKVKLLLNKLTNPSYWYENIGSMSPEGFEVLEEYKKTFPNLEIVYRGFSGHDRDCMTKMLTQQGIQEWSDQELALTKGASHHQKMLLIDCEDANNAKAFILGLNLSPEYRDNLNHYYDYNPDAPDVNWQDLGCVVEGPIIRPIHWHFLQAWERAHGRSLNNYPLINYKIKGSHAPQFCCTQFQENRQEILTSYEKAIGNAHDYIYMENQYFRYIPLAEQIKQRALQLKHTPRLYGKTASDHLYLFVVTHYEIELAIGNTMNTYRMLVELGQQQLMPAIQKTLSEYDPNAWLKTIEISQEQKEKILSPKDEQRIKKIEDIKDLTDIDKYDLDSDKKPFELFEVEGLKVVIGALYTDSTKTATTEQHKGPISYRGVNLHSKLLLVDDLFTSVGSANIHTRGFFTDSEANISLPDHDTAYQIRSTLWQAHANRSYDNNHTTSSASIRCDIKENFKHWNRMMDDNWKHKGKGEPLKGHLVRFWNDTNTSLYVFD